MAWLDECVGKALAERTATKPYGSSYDMLLDEKVVGAIAEKVAWKVAEALAEKIAVARSSP